jgi:hypothetical protein
MPQDNQPKVEDTTVQLSTQELFMDEVSKHSMLIWVVVMFSLIWSAIFGAHFFVGDEVVSEAHVLVVVLPWILLVFFLLQLSAKARNQFWQQIAQKYDWEFEAEVSTSSEKALIFSLGHSRKGRNGIKGTYAQNPFRIFEYQYTVGHGKHAHTYAFTIFEAKFQGTFPHLYLDCDKDGYSHPPSFSMPSLKEVNLPTEFEKIFTLYVPQKYELEALQIFTTDVLAQFIDNMWYYDIEFVDGELVIYQCNQFINFDGLDMELHRIQKLVDLLAPQLNRMRLTQIGDYSPLLKPEGEKPLI